MKRRAVLLLVMVTLVLMLAAMAPTAQAKRITKAGIIPPQATPYGMTYAQWAERWWQWFFAISVDEHPFLDPTGANAAVGQQGPVWFLCGTGIESPTNREVTIPAGKALFLPIYNAEGSVQDTPNDPPFTFAEVTDMMKSWVDAIDIGQVTMDGRALDVVNTPYRTGIYVGTYTPCADNIYSLWGVDLTPGEPISPVAEDGYYVMYAPPSVGHHTLSIHYGDSGSWECTVNYSLTIK
jgi:hypothetical protein